MSSIITVLKLFIHAFATHNAVEHSKSKHSLSSLPNGLKQRA